MNLPFSSMTANRREASVGRTICGGVAGGDGWLKDGQMTVTSLERMVQKAYLGKNKHFIIPHRVQGVPIGRFGSVLPLCVRGKSKYVHLHVHAHFFVCQELA